MRKRLLVLLALPALLFMGSSESYAQVSASDNINVSARNIGIFQFDIVGATFDFGDVDSNGTLSTTGVVGVRNGGNNGANYTATAATTWTASSAPGRTVRVFNASTVSTITWGVDDRLSMQIPATGLPVGSTSCGFLTFSTTGDGVAACAAGNLVHSVAVGNGANSVGGQLDFDLEVLDIDGPGLNTWTVVLTATGI